MENLLSRQEIVIWGSILFIALMFEWMTKVLHVHVFIFATIVTLVVSLINKEFLLQLIIFTSIVTLSILKIFCEWLKRRDRKPNSEALALIGEMLKVTEYNYDTNSYYCYAAGVNWELITIARPSIGDEVFIKNVKGHRLVATLYVKK